MKLYRLVVIFLCSSFLCACGNDATNDDLGNENNPQNQDSDKSCNYTQAKCNADGTARLTCVNGKENSQTCQCKNGVCETPSDPKPTDNDCNYTQAKCNADGTARLTCVNGKENSQTCQCKDGVCETTNSKSIGWCRIMNGSTNIDVTLGNSSESIYAQAFVEGCTNYQNHCATLRAQVGFGQSTQNLASDFIWSDATINPLYDGNGGTDHDEFMGNVTPNYSGTYSILYRMSLDNGQTWTYCDTSDNTDFNASDAITMNVSNPSESPKSIDHCQVNYPSSTIVTVNKESELIFGRVKVAGCTGTESGCNGVIAQLGYGDKNKALNELNYVPAVFNSLANHDGEYDEFMTSLTLNYSGDFAYVYRFSTDNGASWTYCDTEGIATDLNHAGQLKVEEPQNNYGTQWCRFQYVDDNPIEFCSDKKNYYARVRVDGCTGNGGQCDSMIVQIGHAPESETDLNKFTYEQASLNSGYIDDNLSEYIGITRKMHPVGIHNVVFRVSTDNGNNWTYCDNDDDDGFHLEHAAKVEVVWKNFSSYTYRYDAHTDWIDVDTSNRGTDGNYDTYFIVSANKPFHTSVEYLITGVSETYLQCLEPYICYHQFGPYTYHLDDYICSTPEFVSHETRDVQVDGNGSAYVTQHVLKYKSTLTLPSNWYTVSYAFRFNSTEMWYNQELYFHFINPGDYY